MQLNSYFLGLILYITTFPQKPQSFHNLIFLNSILMKVSLFHTETGDMSSPFWGKNKTKQNIAQAKNFCATEDSYLKSGIF